MKKYLCLVFFCLCWAMTFGQDKPPTPPTRVISTIDSSYQTELVLIQTFDVEAPLADVWAAYTTKEGWESWAVPLAAVEWKVGGRILTNYNPKGQIGDSSTIVLHIVNYVPNKLITLQAEITNNYPEFMRKEAKDFYNVIYFDSIESGITQVKSYGIGYKNQPKYLSMLQFFISANEQSLNKLIRYLEGS